jgi:hypothetical protein
MGCLQYWLYGIWQLISHACESPRGKGEAEEKKNLACQSCRITPFLLKGRPIHRTKRETAGVAGKKSAWIGNLHSSKDCQH